MNPLQQTSLPVWIGPVFALPATGYYLLMQTFGTWIAYSYSPPPDRGIVFLPVALVGVALLLGRLLDGFGDLIMGSWSDATRSRWGRRLPFIAVGAAPTGLFFALLWTPPVPGASPVNLVWLMAVSLVYFVGLSAVLCPYLALLPELGRVQADRLRLARWHAIGALLGLAGGAVVSPLLVAQHGFPFMGKALGLTAVVLFLLPVLLLAPVVRSTAGAQPPRPATAGVLRAIPRVLAHPAFRIYALARLCFTVGFYLIVMAVPYVVTVVMGVGEDKVALVSAGTLLVALACIPVQSRLVQRLGAKPALMGMMTFFTALLLAWSLIGRLPWGTPLQQGMVLIALGGVPFAALLLLPPVLIAEISDDAGRRTGQQQEGIYYGVEGLIGKLAVALCGPVFAGVLALGGGPQSPLGVALVGPAGALFSLVGLAVFLRYPLSAPADQSLPGTGGVDLSG